MGSRLAAALAVIAALLVLPSNQDPTLCLNVVLSWIPSLGYWIKKGNRKMCHTGIEIEREHRFKVTSSAFGAHLCDKDDRSLTGH